MSKTVAAETAMVSNFLWNDFWTFRDLSSGQAGWRGRFGLEMLHDLPHPGLLPKGEGESFAGSRIILRRDWPNGQQRNLPRLRVGAVGIVEWFRALWQRDFGRSRAASIGLGLTWLGWSMVVSLVLTLVPEKAWYELKRLSAQASAAEDANVVALKQHAAQTRWVFTDRVIYAFWAGLPVPPELAVIPKKRIWSGQITDAEIVELLERYQPEQLLLLSPWSRMPQLADYVQEHYRAALGVGEEGVYLRK